jgi:hypothetical protein
VQVAIDYQNGVGPWGRAADGNGDTWPSALMHHHQQLVATPLRTLPEDVQLVTQADTLDSTSQSSFIVAGKLAVTPHRKIGPHESLRAGVGIGAAILKLWLVSAPSCGLFLRLAVG